MRILIPQTSLDDLSQRRPVKILNIFGRMGRGGAEMRTLELMRRLDPNVYQLDFCVLSGLAGELDAEIQSLGGKVLPCRLGILFPWRFKKLIKNGEYDIIHSHVAFFSGLILGLAKSVGVRGRIAHFRSTLASTLSFRRKIQNVFMGYMVNHYATKIIAVGKGVMLRCWGNDWDKDPRKLIIYDGCDHTHFLGMSSSDLRKKLELTPEHRVVIHVGRFDPPKNHERLIEIFYELFKKEPMARLVLLGRGGNEIERRIQTRITELNLKNRIFIVGEQSNVHEWMAAADLLLFPSLWEGLPGVVLEACAAGIPVVASDLPGSQEIASYFPSVYINSLQSSNDQWANKIHEILNSPNDRVTIQNQFIGTPFTLEKFLGAHEELWGQWRINEER